MKVNFHQIEVGRKTILFLRGRICEKNRLARSVIIINSINTLGSLQSLAIELQRSTGGEVVVTENNAEVEQPIIEEAELEEREELEQQPEEQVVQEFVEKTNKLEEMNLHNE